MRYFPNNTSQTTQLLLKPKPCVVLLFLYSTEFPLSNYLWCKWNGLYLIILICVGFKTILALDSLLQFGICNRHSHSYCFLACKHLSARGKKISGFSRSFVSLGSLDLWPFQMFVYTQISPFLIWSLSLGFPVRLVCDFEKTSDGGIGFIFTIN